MGSLVVPSFSLPLSFFQSSCSRRLEDVAFTNDQGQIDSRWSFYKLLALELWFINLKQMGGIRMRDPFMPLPPSGGKHAHILWITRDSHDTDSLSSVAKGPGYPTGFLCPSEDEKERNSGP